jgi:hypothetical protein
MSSILIMYIKSKLDELSLAKTKSEKANIIDIMFTYILHNGIHIIRSHTNLRKIIIDKCFEMKYSSPEFKDLCNTCNKLLRALDININEDMEIPTITEEYNPELVLFTIIARRIGFKEAVEDITTYYSQYKSYSRDALLCSCDIGSTVSKKMTTYLENNYDMLQRNKLMEYLFSKYNLTITSDVMPLYVEWSKHYTPSGRINRYIKMNEFVQRHKELFMS